LQEKRETMPVDRTVLVVDDEETVCHIMARMLLEAGYSVATATSGDEALRLMNNGHSKAVHLVIADVCMPDMDGPQMAERLRQYSSTPPVLFMSGATSPPRIRGLPGPLLRKPFSEADLLREVRRLIGDD